MLQSSISTGAFSRSPTRASHRAIRGHYYRALPRLLSHRDHERTDRRSQLRCLVHAATLDRKNWEQQSILWTGTAAPTRRGLGAAPSLLERRVEDPPHVSVRIVPSPPGAASTRPRKSVLAVPKLAQTSASRPASPQSLPRAASADRLQRIVPAVRRVRPGAPDEGLDGRAAAHEELRPVLRRRSKGLSHV